MSILKIILLVLAIILVILGVADLIHGAVAWGLVLIVVGLVLGAVSDRFGGARL